MLGQEKKLLICDKEDWYQERNLAREKILSFVLLARNGILKCSSIV